MRPRHTGAAASISDGVAVVRPQNGPRLMMALPPMVLPCALCGEEGSASFDMSKRTATACAYQQVRRLHPINLTGSEGKETARDSRPTYCRHRR